MANICNPGILTQPLLDAAKNGNCAIAEVLLINGANINDEPLSPLIEAAFHGQLEFVRFLLNWKVKVEVNYAFNRMTALYYAIGRGHPAVARLLIQHGATFNTPSFDTSVSTFVSTPGNTSLKRPQKIDYLKAALWSRNNEVVDLVLEQIDEPKQVESTVIDVSAPDESGITPMMFIINADIPNRADFLQKLLSKGANPNIGHPLLIATYRRDIKSIKILATHPELNWNARLDKKSSELVFGTPELEGNTALVTAVKTNDFDVIKLLVDSGKVDVNMVGENNGTALFHATILGNKKVVQLLIENKADPNIENNKGAVPHLRAVFLDEPDVLEIILNSGKADINHCFKKNGLTVLHIAVEHQKTEHVRLLIKFGADPNIAETVSGLTPIMIAARDGLDDILEILLSHSKGNERKVDLDKRSLRSATAMDLAVICNKIKCAKLLLSHKPNLNQCTANGRTPLMNAAAMGHTELVRLLVDKQWQIDVDAVSDEGTAIIFAARYGHYDCFKILLDRDANPWISFKHKISILIFAAMGGNPKIISELLRQKPDIDQQCQAGSTALMRAVEKNNIEAAKLLLNKGANPNLADHQGYTALLVAAKNGHVEMIELLAKGEQKINYEATRIDGMTAVNLAKNAKTIKMLQFYGVRGRDAVFCSSCLVLVLLADGEESEINEYLDAVDVREIVKSDYIDNEDEIPYYIIANFARARTRLLVAKRILQLNYPTSDDSALLTLIDSIRKSTRK